MGKKLGIILQRNLKTIFYISFFLPALSSFAQTDSSYQMRELTKGNFSIQYPTSWRVDTSGTLGTELFLFSPLENEADKFSENLNILIQDLAGKNIDLATYKEITEAQIANLVTDGEIFESVLVKSAKGEYYKVFYAMTQGKFKVKVISYCFIINEKAYLITFGGEIDKYGRYEKIGKVMLDSFYFIK